MMRRQEYAGKLQSELRTWKKEASAQLAMRQAAKLEANRQYVAARQSKGLGD